MKVGQLKEILNIFNDNTDIFIGLDGRQVDTLEQIENRIVNCIDINKSYNILVLQDDNHCDIDYHNECIHSVIVRSYIRPDSTKEKIYSYKEYNNINKKGKNK